MTEVEVAPRQKWAPNAGTGPGGGMLRVVCLYPFEAHEDEVVWVVEYLDYVHKLERVSERMLREGWHLVEDVDS